MPYFFRFFGGAHDDQPPVAFECPLQCSQCAAVKADGTQCRNRTCVATPFCWIHMLRERHLRVRESTIEGAGKGLFAILPKGQPNDIVFRKNDVIIDYAGEAITEAELNQRYGNYTAPYALQSRHYIEDAACRRGAGAMVNHATGNRVNVVFIFNLDSGHFELVAKKNIRNGEELFVNYGKVYRFNEENSRYSTIRRRR